MDTPLLTMDQLTVDFDTPNGNVRAVDGVSFGVNAGEIFGIVGESGSGKSQTVLAPLGLTAKNSRVSGSARFRGRELIGLSERELNRIRGADIAMIFQDPASALNPYLTVARQMTEALGVHRQVGRREARRRALELLDAVRLPDAARRVNCYPHELSGGQCQRVMIAMALMTRPTLLIADEPTTALDVTVQAQILDLLKDIRRDFGTAIVLITHDFGVVAGTCDRVMVMRTGTALEMAPVETLFAQPAHAYTRELLAAAGA